jgi:hypothetical protein
MKRFTMLDLLMFVLWGVAACRVARFGVDLYRQGFYPNEIAWGVAGASAIYIVACSAALFCVRRWKRLTRSGAASAPRAGE